MLTTNNTLTLLDLSDNEIGGFIDGPVGHRGPHSGYPWKTTPEGPAALADGLKANTGVQQLHAKSNGLRAAGAQAFGEALKTNNTLTFLDLSGNEIGGFNTGPSYDLKFTATPEGPAALADGLKANSVVQQLNVSSNSLDQSSKDELTKQKPPQLTLNM